MRFLVDECSGPAVTRTLRQQGHDVFCVFEQARGADDDEVIRRAVAENRILITNDKDFGEKVYRDGALHTGIVLLRLRAPEAAAKTAALTRLLRHYSDRLEGSFVIVADRRVRFARLIG